MTVAGRPVRTRATGEKTLRAEVLLGVQGTADTQEKLTVLRDAYTYQGAALTFSGRDVVIRTGQGAPLPLNPARRRCSCPTARPLCAGCLPRLPRLS